MSLKVVIYFFLSLSVFSDVIVISDIDDTLKRANSMGKAHEQVYHFFRKKTYKDMVHIFQGIKEWANKNGEQVHFFYVSAAYDFTFKEQKWLRKNAFPKGESYLRSVGSGKTYPYKYDTIEKILKRFEEKLDTSTVFFFGDNSSQDANVYNDISFNLGLSSQIFIRDVSTKKTFFVRENDPFDKSVYFFTEIDIFSKGYLDFLERGIFNRVYDSYLRGRSLPRYTYKTLKRRIRKMKDCSKFSRSCRKKAKKKAKKLIRAYFDKF